MTYSRWYLKTLKSRLAEKPRTMIVVAGPRQVGKTTLVRQALAEHSATLAATDDSEPVKLDPFSHSASTTQVRPDAPPNAQWLIEQWRIARVKARSLAPQQRHVLAIDEVQKIPRWSEIIKGLWDADRAVNLPMHVVLLGSAPLLMQQGLTESLAGRFETIPISHWSYSEMQAAFDFTLDQYIYFGGYPGAVEFMGDESRWRHYVKEALIKPNIEKDILQLTRVNKPALLRQLFELGCGAYSGQIITLTKLIEHLQDVGNTTTLSHYLELLSQAWLLTGLQKYASKEHRKRAAPPKLNAHNTALISAQGNYTFEQAKNDRTRWGHLVESAVGSHLINNKSPETQVYYWREEPSEVDFVLTYGDKILAIEVKSSDHYEKPKGLQAFTKKFPSAQTLVVGAKDVPIAEFLLRPVEFWIT
jgi:uncharacterized protein